MCRLVRLIRGRSKRADVSIREPSRRVEDLSGAPAGANVVGTATVVSGTAMVIASGRLGEERLSLVLAREIAGPAGVEWPAGEVRTVYPHAAASGEYY